MVFCTYCGQSFTRDEHLERHILTHTNVKPFKCFTCHMSFARRDLLQRHYTVHGRDQNQNEIPAVNGMIPKSAGRTPIACSNCAKTKTKCDKKFPCSRCAGRNLRCTLRPTRRASKNANRVGATLESATDVPTEVTTVNVEATSKDTRAQENSSSPSSQKSGTPISIGPIMEETPDIAPPQPFTEQVNGGPTPPEFSPDLQESFMDHNLMSGFPGLTNPSKDSSDDGSSPRFLLDWSQMQMPLGYDNMIQSDLMLDPELSFDPNSVPLAPHADGILSIMPELANGGMESLITPFETPKMSRSFVELGLGNSNPAFHSHRHQSMPSVQSIPNSGNEMPAMIAAQDGWSAFRCTPTLPSSSCPKTAKLNLEQLEETLRNHEGWVSWSPRWEDNDLAGGGDHLTVMQLHESTRDKLLAIMQSFLHKALETHREGRGTSNGSHSPNPSGASNFVLLPPGRVLEYFLRSYSNSFERYFPLTSRSTLDANELMHCYNDRAASILVLLMIAQGAANIPSPEARMLTGGLTEACRISLFDLIERNIIMSGDPIVLHSALLFTVQAAWSGDKWQMDIAMGQRGMYFAMLRHSGVLDRSSHAASAQPQRTLEQLWTDWIQNESRSRLIYSWVMVDQDLALFHDTAPLFSVTEFGAPMPDADRLWHAKSAEQWSSTFERVHEFSSGFSSVGSGARPLSLRDLFRHFLDDDLIPMGIEMTPLQLRLLLHPLQSMVCQFSQLLSCFAPATYRTSISVHPNQAQPSSRNISQSSTRTRLAEVQALLQRWFDLAERYLKANPLCALMQTNLILFHLISLNAVTNFPEIERLARRENVDGTYHQLLWLHKRCIPDVEEAVFHCGQIFRLVRSMPRGVRPPWWAGAIYRVALILWTDSLTHKDALTSTSPQGNGMFPSPIAGPSFAIDALPPDHALIVRYLTKREGVPCVTKLDGSQMGLERAYPVLRHCVEVIDEGCSTRFSDAIRGKLERLSRG
ncbi:unnamed protein product [Zymoseptoria tritici ST99CH_3D7]|uniref:Transcription factor MYCGRDRAFT_87993 n=3 Tax=Zymoseptoria tritici TaxID=1047171 RepID=TF29_ZYMTI|nr:uncharacterized protein MYCGRDRAFT_87993 [Zymoseptoria tritici IPO323]F9XMW5.1 RecName: Full=Transcription factor MYCGRDRAFT_87993; AltName: Full=Conidial pigment biosynthesis cluster 29 protein MYCGRDRAFT_87993 [Zymoseptoria tritici IPO323]EGP83310.1 hypothetical protein MYCGRDRAFT_87993 [Zymoseptoria tritici IPO323]SMQ55175.1 unnamed protein product [Zymoseptoria tritici ST99CH_3D7]SMR60385.1 unnamed protein product [Zymoseptoria tritici ST99CH_1E4]